MRPVFLLLLVGVGIVTWLLLARPGRQTTTPAPQTLAVSQYSNAFNNGVQNVLTAYERLSEAFVNWDSVAAAGAAGATAAALDSIAVDELKKDSGALAETAVAFIDNAKTDVQTIASEKTIRAQREAFNSLGDNLYQFLNTVKYDREKIYLQQCPMAFDDTQAARWLSRQEKIRNPYLGLKDPQYGKGMLSCGETLKTVNHTGKD